MRSGKAIFVGEFKFSASEERDNLDSTASAAQIEEYLYVYPSTQEYQQLQDKLKHDFPRDKSGRDWGMIGDPSGGDQGESTRQWLQLWHLYLHGCTLAICRPASFF